MFNHGHYVPILKWRMGEYQALFRLSESVKSRITPVLEIPDVGFDFEAGAKRTSIDEHIADFGRRLKSKWQDRLCFVDLTHLSAHSTTHDGIHFADRLFESVRSESCRAIPVIHLTDNKDFLKVISKNIRLDQQGACLRLKLLDFDRPSFSHDIEGLLRELNLNISETDILIDLAAPNYQPFTASVRYMSTLLSLVPALNRWRTLTIAGTSYPQSVAFVKPPFEIVERHEWKAYQELLRSLGRETRIPTFGDYAVAHPDIVEFDMRLVKPFAKLRYTIDNAWHIGRGTPVRTDGFGQYQALCATLIAQSYYSGPSFSAGDQYIANCAAGKDKTGNLSTWVWVSNNRHLTKVVSDLASLHAFSVAA